MSIFLKSRNHPTLERYDCTQMTRCIKKENRIFTRAKYTSLANDNNGISQYPFIMSLKCCCPDVQHNGHRLNSKMRTTLSTLDQHVALSPEENSGDSRDGVPCLDSAWEMIPSPSALTNAAFQAEWHVSSLLLVINDRHSGQKTLLYCLGIDRVDQR